MQLEWRKSLLGSPCRRLQQEPLPADTWDGLVPTLFNTTFAKFTYLNTTLNLNELWSLF